MPDISMCADDKCPSRTTCKRNKASGTVASYWQAYADFTHDDETGKCGDYWPVIEKVKE